MIWLYCLASFILGGAVGTVLFGLCLVLLRLADHYRFRIMFDQVEDRLARWLSKNKK